MNHRIITRILFLLVLFVTLSGCHQLRRQSNSGCTDPNCPNAQCQNRTGCQGCCSCCLCPEDDLEGIVRVSGQFATAQALPITKNGLTLAQVVEQTLRKGIRPGEIVFPYADESPSVQDVPLLTFTELETEKSLLKEIAALVDADGNVNEQELDERVSRAVQFYTNLHSELRDEEESLRQEVREAMRLAALEAKVVHDIVTAADFAAGETTPADTTPGDVEEKWVQRIRSEVNGRITTFAPPILRNSDSNSRRPMIPTYYQAAVKLSRRSGETIVFPLWLVEQFQAGDVGLRDGDLVSILHYSRTGLIQHSGNRLRNEDIALNRLLNQQLGTSASELKNYIDMFRISRLGANGGLETFIIPRETPSLFGSEPGFSFVLDNAYVKRTDLVKPATLDLEPVIRLGKREAILRSVDALKVKTCLEQFDDEQRRLHEKIANIPVIGDACQFVESTTGFNSAEVFTSARECVENAVGLVQ